MQLRTLIVSSTVVLLAAAGAWWWLRDGDGPTSWRTVTISRQDVKATVSATGSLEAVTTVEVGTQVSGRLSEILVDFNDQVEAGQVIARLDTSILEADVASAEALVAVRQAELVQAEQELARSEALVARGAEAQQQLESDRNSLAVAQAQLRSARTSLQRARQNLGYATITSPVTGTVIERSVDQGQTVNAGMTAPTLFIIAGDLARMQILTSVDEADIGRIAPGQAVDFTVQAFDREHFAGTVDQVRLQSTTLENVVTYAVVVAVDNSDGRLLPGMTATADFIVAEAPDVLCVPNAALRFRPESDQVVAEAADQVAAAGGGRRGRRGAGGAGTLWLPAAEGLVRPLTVTTGLTDGSCTEVSGEWVTEGLEVVAGVSTGRDAAAESASPFQQQQSRRRPGGF